MRSFSEIMKAERYRRPIHTTVGNNEIYIGTSIDGFLIINKEIIKWLDSREYIHCYISNKEIHLVYRPSKKFENLFLRG